METSGSATGDWLTDQVVIRKLILSAAFSASKGHIGSSLSIADLLLAADQVTGGIGSHSSENDFVLSKGHAAGALYSLLALRGRISEKQLLSYCRNGSVFGTHPSVEVPGVIFASGSLGQGVGFAVGVALANQMRGNARSTICIVSDAEINEGSTWEALLIAAHYRLANLTILVDSNGQQALGLTKDVLNTDGFQEAVAALGWAVAEADGHNVKALISQMSEPSCFVPRMLICKTVSGSGISFMEHQVVWHYLPMTTDQYEAALAELAVRN